MSEEFTSITQFLQALAALNQLDPDVWFREVQYLPTSSSRGGRQSENETPVLVVTAYDYGRGGDFLNTTQVQK